MIKSFSNSYRATINCNKLNFMLINVPIIAKFVHKEHKNKFSIIILTL